ncbi:MAG: transporter substrate-binding domain-containing protein [Campylobacteraceae bacterium]|nr:transporter substrate-binding domain-containing protein [Campylobacteraceae bacterium]
MFKLYFIVFLFFSLSHASPIVFNTAAQDSDPKYFLDEQNKMKGLCIDIMMALESVDPEIKFKGQNIFLPFKRMSKMLKNGELDLFFGFVKNEIREKEYVFIDPALYTVNHVIAVRKDDTVEVNSFDDIRNLGKDGKIMTIFGTSTKRYLDKQGGLIIDDHGRTISSNLKMLLKNRGRFVYYHNLGLITSIKKDKWENKIKVLPTSFRQYSQYVAFSKHVSKEKIQKIKTALEKLRLSGRLDTIFNKYAYIQ